MPKKGGKNKGSSKKGRAKPEATDNIDQILDEWFYMGPNFNEKRKEKYKKEIGAAFKMFERVGEGGGREKSCDWREVKTIVRSLNLNPTKDQLAQMLDEMEDPEPSAFIKYERLEEVLLKILLTKEYIPKTKRAPQEGEVDDYASNLLVRDSEETIVNAFKVLDTAKRGELEAEAFGNLMMKSGRPGEDFEREEVVDMIQAAADPDSGLVKYEDSLYVDQLAND